MYKFKKIMIPLDGSELAEAAVGPALAIAKSMAAEVVLFRVAQRVPRTQKLAEMPDVYEDVIAATYREAEDYLKDLRGRLAYEHISIEHRPALGGIARQILDFVAESDVDLIVLSSHGRTGVDRWIHGNVAQKVITGCACSTLIIRGEKHE
jgi:nucleotide-binding universal stress UspA family protein